MRSIDMRPFWVWNCARSRRTLTILAGCRRLPSQTRAASDFISTTKAALFLGPQFTFALSASSRSNSFNAKASACKVLTTSAPIDTYLPL